MLVNLQNYGIYSNLIKTGYIEIYTSSINDQNIAENFYSILNIFKDGIELEEVHKMKIRVHFCDNKSCTLSIFDYFFNLIMWKLATGLSQPISSKYLFFPVDITRDYLKRYIDNLCIKPYRVIIPFITLNNVIDDSLEPYKYINIFAWYLCNTLCLEDNIDMMKDKEFYESMHPNMSNIPIQDAKQIGLDYANKQIDIIKNSNHCLRDSFRTGEGVNTKQYKEVSIDIGPKPDGMGNTFPESISTNFLIGGVNNPLWYIIESNGGRTAQRFSKVNVGVSGAFANVLGLNNVDTRLHSDPTYDCRTRNFLVVDIKDSTILFQYDMRYYRFMKNGPEFLLDAYRDKHLIGKRLFFRSPIKCASKEKYGICYKCYGDLAYFNYNINIGKLAAELLSSVLTQRQLSAKHLLESVILEMNWVPEFKMFFDVDFTFISVIEDDNLDLAGFSLIIDPASIYSEDDIDDEIITQNYNEYITEFTISTPNGENISIHTNEFDEIYLSDELIALINSKYNIDNSLIILDMTDVSKLDIVFAMHVKNNELSHLLESAKRLINKASEVARFSTIDELVAEFISTLKKGGIKLNAIHQEIILSNQIRDVDDIIDFPDWKDENAQYQILTLSKSLRNHPSIAISLQYQEIRSAFTNPLSYKKKRASQYDLFYMEQPQMYIDDDSIVSDEYQFKSDKDQSPLPAITIYNNENN